MSSSKSFSTTQIIHAVTLIEEKEKNEKKKKKIGKASKVLIRSQNSLKPKNEKEEMGKWKGKRKR